MSASFEARGQGHPLLLFFSLFMLLHFILNVLWAPCSSQSHWVLTRKEFSFIEVPQEILKHKEQLEHFSSTPCAANLVGETSTKFFLG